MSSNNYQEKYYIVQLIVIVLVDKYYQKLQLKE